MPDERPLPCENNEPTSLARAQVSRDGNGATALTSVLMPNNDACDHQDVNSNVTGDGICNRNGDETGGNSSKKRKRSVHVLGFAPAPAPVKITAQVTAPAPAPAPIHSHPIPRPKQSITRLPTQPPIQPATPVQPSLHPQTHHQHPQHPQNPSSLLRLPPELLTQIYTLALQKPVSPIPLLSLSHSNTCDTEPPLLSTCHAVRDHALPIFYRCNDWVVKSRCVNNYSPGMRRGGKEMGSGFEIVPGWVEGSDEEKLGLIRRVVWVGTRESFVDRRGVWRERERAAFRVTGTGVSARVEEVVDDEDGDGQGPELQYRPEYRGLGEGKRKKGKRKGRGKEMGRGNSVVETAEEEMVCGIRLIDLLRARMKSFGGPGGKESWTWTRERILDVAGLL